MYWAKSSSLPNQKSNWASVIVPMATSPPYLPKSTLKYLSGFLIVLTSCSFCFLVAIVTFLCFEDWFPILYVNFAIILGIHNVKLEWSIDSQLFFLDLPFVLIVIQPTKS